MEIRRGKTNLKKNKFYVMVSAQTASQKKAISEHLLWDKKNVKTNYNPYNTTAENDYNWQIAFEFNTLEAALEEAKKQETIRRINRFDFCFSIFFHSKLSNSWGTKLI